MKKKVVSLLLAVVLLVSLLPVGAVSAAAATVAVFICGEGYNPGNEETIYGGNDGKVVTSTDAATWSLKKDNSAPPRYTLTLKGFNAELDGNEFAAIASRENILILLEGENEIEMGSADINKNTKLKKYYGIYCDKAGVTIEGTGDLTVNGKSITVTGDMSTEEIMSYGIYAENGVTINGSGNVTASGGNISTEPNGEIGYAKSYGIVAEYGVTINGSGNVTASGGNILTESYGKIKYAESYGIVAAKYVTISGSGNVTANGGNVRIAPGQENGTAKSHGIHCEAISIDSDGVIKATGGDVAGNDSGSGYSYGMQLSSGDMTVKKGDVECIGGTVTGQGGSYGVAAPNVTVTGGKLRSAGGDAGSSDKKTGRSYGVQATNVTVTGGQVESSGGAVAGTGDQVVSRGLALRGTLSIGREGSDFTGSFEAGSDNGQALEYVSLSLNGVKLRAYRGNIEDYTGEEQLEEYDETVNAEYIFVTTKSAPPPQPQREHKNFDVVAGTPLPDSAPEVQEVNPNTGLWRLF